MADVLTTGRIRLTLEIDWHANFDGKAVAADIYTTAAKECEQRLRNALTSGEVRYRIIGEIEPIMVIYPVKKS